MVEKDKFEDGKFIVLYGCNVLGKTLQAELLVDKMAKAGIDVAYPIKYPIYELEPTGPKINSEVRIRKTMNDFDLQKEYAQNRRDFEPFLRESLKSGISVVAEDYVGTGIAWGMAKGLIQEQIEYMNRDLLVPDISILLDGLPFSTGRERNHRFEDDEKGWWLAKEYFLAQATEQKWHIVDANQLKEKVHDHIWDIVHGEFGING